MRTPDVGSVARSKECHIERPNLSFRICDGQCSSYEARDKGITIDILEYIYIQNKHLNVLKTV